MPIVTAKINSQSLHPICEPIYITIAFNTNEKISVCVRARESVQLPAWSFRLEHEALKIPSPVMSMSSKVLHKNSFKFYDIKCHFNTILTVLNSAVNIVRL